MCFCRICLISTRLIIIIGMIKLTFSLLIVAASITALALLLQTLQEWTNQLIGIFSSIICFTIIYGVILSFALHGLNRRKHTFIFPFMIYSIIHLFAYIIILGYATSILYKILQLYAISLLAVFTLEGTCFVIGLCLQVYFFLIIYNKYLKIRSRSEKSQGDQLENMQRLNNDQVTNEAEYDDDDDD